MTPKRSRKQIERIKKAHSRATGRHVMHKTKLGTVINDRVKSKLSRINRVAEEYGTGPADSVNKAETYGTAPVDEQPKPRVPLLSGGSDPTLGKKFEEELHRP